MIQSQQERQPHASTEPVTAAHAAAPRGPAAHAGGPAHDAAAPSAIAGDAAHGPTRGAAAPGGVAGAWEVDAGLMDAMGLGDDTDHGIKRHAAGGAAAGKGQLGGPRKKRPRKPGQPAAPGR